MALFLHVTQYFMPCAGVSSIIMGAIIYFNSIMVAKAVVCIRGLGLYFVLQMIDEERFSLSFIKVIYFQVSDIEW